MMSFIEITCKNKGFDMHYQKYQIIISQSKYASYHKTKTKQIHVVHNCKWNSDQTSVATDMQTNKYYQE
jgi:hypothetical protein